MQKYGIKATFYIPKTNAERRVMSENDLQVIAKDFEIGGHTINHVRLCNMPVALLEKEIGGSFRWLADLTGTAPASFCFPGGVVQQTAVAMARKTGYKVLRTTALHSIQLTDKAGLLSTTLQVYAHKRPVHAKHLLQRQRWQNLVGWLRTNATTDLAKLTNAYLNQIDVHGGCFHLWGHSWEIDENNLWQKLETVFQVLANRSGFSYIENKDATITTRHQTC